MKIVLNPEYKFLQQFVQDLSNPFRLGRESHSRQKKYD